MVYDMIHVLVIVMQYVVLTRVIGSVVAWNRQVHRYSPELLARMPVKFVLQQSQKTPSLYSGVYSPLLR